MEAKVPEKVSSRKKTEAQQLQIDVYNEEGWKSIIARKGLLVVDVYARWCGPCTSMTGHLRRIKMELGDDCLTMATADADGISSLASFRGRSEPTFIFFGCGKPLCVVHGANGPMLILTIRDRLKLERSLSKGEETEEERQTVLLESLIKPEEIIESDEDLDDAEGEKMENESDEEVLTFNEAVLFISPNIIATDKIEAFLSHLVFAGMTITGHVQEELPTEELLTIIQPPKITNIEDITKEKETEEEKNETIKGNTKENPDKPVSDEVAEEPEPDLQFWEEELAKGPLYMLLLRVETGDITEAWDTLLGPPDVTAAKTTHPNSLIAQFGDEDLVIPAWLPKGVPLQRRLKERFFPPPPDADSPRLLLLPDADDHQQVLEALCRGGLQVLAHTQALLTEDIYSALNIVTSANGLQDHVGSQLLAAVITGENAVSVSTELRSLHLTAKSEHSIQEISAFFPDLATDLGNESSTPEEPQTQMQIEQKKENSNK